MSNPTKQEREALAERLRQIAESQRMDFDSPHVAMTLDEAADMLMVTPPTPHVVETVEGLEALPDGAVIQTSGYQRVAQKLLGHWYFPGALDSSTFRQRILPATVLAPAPAPVDREALHVKIAAAMHALGPCDDADCLDPDDWGYCDKRTALALDAIEEVRRG